MNNCQRTFAPLCILMFQRFPYSNNKEYSIREILHTQISQLLAKGGEKARLGTFHAHERRIRIVKWPLNLPNSLRNTHPRMDYLCNVNVTCCLKAKC